ncbi:hypothetical protein ABN034_30210 [Actinopolymorpha sp. B11F2]
MARHLARPAPHLLEDLEGVQRTRRLALRRPQVRLEAPAETTVVVPVRRDSSEERLRPPLAGDQVEAPSVEQPGMGRHEGRGPVQVDVEIDVHARHAARGGRVPT